MTKERRYDDLKKMKECTARLIKESGTKRSEVKRRKLLENGNEVKCNEQREWNETEWSERGGTTQRRQRMRSEELKKKRLLKAKINITIHRV